MSNKNRDKDDSAFLARFKSLSDETPVDDAEADEILKDAGIDAAAAFDKTLSHIASTERRLKEERFARAEAERCAALAASKPAASKPAARKRSRSELLAVAGRLKQTAGAQAYFRSLESISDDELEELVTQLEELASRGEEKK